MLSHERIGITEGDGAVAGDERPKKGGTGLREIRALLANTQIFDAGPGAVPAFGARRRGGRAVSYFVMFRTEGRPAAPLYDRSARRPLDP